MGSDNGNWVTGAPLLADGEGDDGGAVAGEIVLAAGAEGGGPGVSFADEGEAGLFEALGGGLNGVVGFLRTSAKNWPSLGRYSTYGWARR